jgi:hypothetical protein
VRGSHRRALFALLGLGFARGRLRAGITHKGKMAMTDANAQLKNGVFNEYFKDGGVSCTGKYRNGEHMILKAKQPKSRSTSDEWRNLKTRVANQE